MIERITYLFRDILELYGEMLIKRKNKSDFDLGLMLDISSALDKVIKVLSKLDDYLDEFKLGN